MPDMCPPIVRRQGDVLLVELDELPPQLEPVPREDGRLVLAHGEATGHAHVIKGEAQLLADLDEIPPRRRLAAGARREGRAARRRSRGEMAGRFLRVQAESRLLHEEHATLAVPPGNYRVVRQREYTPNRPRFVAD